MIRDVFGLAVVFVGVFALVLAGLLTIFPSKASRRYHASAKWLASRGVGVLLMGVIFLLLKDNPIIRSTFSTKLQMVEALYTLLIVVFGFVALWRIFYAVIGRPAIPADELPSWRFRTFRRAVWLLVILTIMMALLPTVLSLFRQLL